MQLTNAQKYKLLAILIGVFSIGGYAGYEIGNAKGMEEVERITGVAQNLYKEQQSLRFQLDNEREQSCEGESAKRDYFEDIKCSTTEIAAELASSTELKDQIIGRVCMAKIANK
ncbi:hypothetical protein A3715_20135 [Oleiphilus sp. HI0009]|nr:hypothetical protein A3715_20135 [Oleiphilus sp. HI0009]